MLIIGDYWPRDMCVGQLYRFRSSDACLTDMTTRDDEFYLIVAVQEHEVLVLATSGKSAAELVYLRGFRGVSLVSDLEAS